MTLAIFVLEQHGEQAVGDRSVRFSGYRSVCLYTWEKWISCTYGVLPMYTWQLQRIKKEIQMKWPVVKSKRTIEEKEGESMVMNVGGRHAPGKRCRFSSKSTAHFTNLLHILQIHSVLYSLQFLFFTHTLQIQSVLYGLISFTILLSTLSTNTLLIQGTFPILSFICTVLLYILQSMIFCQPFCIT